jgi:hypothetical protein
MNGKMTLRRMVMGGVLLSSLHFIWAGLVYLAMAQPSMDFIFKIHMLNSPLQVQAFEWGYASLLIAVTFSLGAFYGWLYSLIKLSVDQMES